MDSPGLLRHRADSSPHRIVHRSSHFLSVMMSRLTQESTGSSEDADLVPIHSGEDWVAQLDDDLSQPSAVAGDSFRISALQREDLNCITLHTWISSGEFPSWNEVKGLYPGTSLAMASS